MFINKLTVENVRNLSSVNIPEFKQINVFTGDNGAGKTSVLESLYIASVGRSFRHQQIKPMLNVDSHFLRVYLECTDNTGRLNKLGIERNHKNDYKIRINGEKATTLAHLSRLLPIIVIDSTSFNLLDGASNERRKFLDWGVFHVEHSFYDDWREYAKILKQRNAILKTRPSSYALLKPWDQQLSMFAHKVEQSRHDFLVEFIQKFSEVLNALDSDLNNQLKVAYKNGWGGKYWVSDVNDVFSVPTQESIQETLADNFDKDVKYQRTTDGSHRADLQLFFGKQLVKDTFSRGQKKTIVSALKLTQASLVYDHAVHQPIVLLDDMPSELDQIHLDTFFNYLADLNYQMFITGVDRNVFERLNLKEPLMFHVEHGGVSL